MTDFDVAVIGGGPGGYVAAVRASQLGLKTAVVEKASLGGVCVNWGCIPTKSLLASAEAVHTLSQGRSFGFSVESALADYAAAHKRSRQTATRQLRRIEALLKAHDIEVIAGTAFLSAPGRIEIAPEGRTVTAGNVIVATGSRTRPLPGVEFDGERIIAFRRALELAQAPKSPVIVGAGPIGMEFATVWSRYGAKVTVVEMMPAVLPLEDEEVSTEAARQFKRAKITTLTGARVEGVELADDGAIVRVVDGENNKSEIEADLVLSAIGFLPNSEGLGLEELGVELDRGRVGIDDRMKTNIDGVYAIGDVTGKLGLAHTASAQGIIAAEAIAGRETRVLDYDLIPRCVYSWPEVASVGLTEARARERGLDVKTAVSPFAGNGKAVALGDNIGFVKMIADKADGRVIGVHMIGPHVTELIAGPAALMALGANAEQMGRAVYPHPTLSEAVMEAAHALAGHAIHI